MFLDYATIIGRAAWVRHQSGFIGKEPPYSSRLLMEQVFPKIPVSGTTLPTGVTEMAVAETGRRALFYNRHAPHTSQRVGLVHGLYHHLSDLKEMVGLRECNIPFRKLGSVQGKRDPVELSCDLFAAEVLVPLDVLHDYAPAQLFARDPQTKDAIEDEVDTLSSRFNVPKGFMKWRLWDLRWLRSTHYNTEI